jgi:hypothetical protein
MGLPSFHPKRQLALYTRCQAISYQLSAFSYQLSAKKLGIREIGKEYERANGEFENFSFLSCVFMFSIFPRSFPFPKLIADC